jgi:hypothetical protein
VNAELYTEPANLNEWHPMQFLPVLWLEPEPPESEESSLQAEKRSKQQTANKPNAFFMINRVLVSNYLNLNQ